MLDESPAISVADALAPPQPQPLQPAQPWQTGAQQQGSLSGPIQPAAPVLSQEKVQCEAETAGSRMASSSDPAQQLRVRPAASKSSSRHTARRSLLFSTQPLPQPEQQPDSSPERHLDFEAHFLDAPTPTYVSRSQQQESMHDISSAAPAHNGFVHASPAMSEMVYELRPAAAAQSRVCAEGSCECEPARHAASEGSLKWDDFVHSTVGDSGAAMAYSGTHCHAATTRQPHGDASAGRFADSGPAYSGYSSEMRAAARQAADALLAEATSPSVHFEANGVSSRQPEGDCNTPEEECALDCWPPEEDAHAVESHVQRNEAHAVLSVDEIEQQIKALFEYFT